jgi:hypothetical protein
MSSKTVEDLTDEELLIIFRGPDSPLDGFDLVNLELVCKRWWVCVQALVGSGHTTS